MAAAAGGGAAGLLRVAVIGSGPTGALVAAAIAAQLPGARVTVLDKGRLAGGRMSSARLRDGSGQADHGAQLIAPGSGVSEPYVAELVGAGVLAPVPADSFLGARAPLYCLVAPRGTASIVGHYLAQSKAALVTDARVTSLSRAGAAAGCGGGATAAAAAWRATTDKGEAGEYDAVVCTIPAPQVLQLGGDVPALLAAAGLDAGLRAVAFSVRFASVAFYAPGSLRQLRQALPFAGRFLEPAEDDALCYVGFDSHKRALAGAHDGDSGGGGSGGGSSSSSSPSVVVHSSTAFGAAHAHEDPTAVGGVLLERLRVLYPGLPPPASVKHHRWLYSQVTLPFPGAAHEPGAVLACAAPPLILGGDSFSGSSFEGCVASARAAVAALRRALGA